VNIGSGISRQSQGERGNVAMRRLRKILYRLIVGIVVVAAVAGLGCYLYMHRSLPTEAGVVKVHGLRAAVSIVRDTDAIPHIYAQDLYDATFGLGYVHAQDRLWQMEFQRRIGQGRLSEFLGEDALSSDRFLRTIGIYRAAQSAWEKSPTGTRQIINAYVSGINAFIADHSGSGLPPEFTLFDVTPAVWTGPDVIVWAKMLALQASVNYDAELLRTDILATLGPQRTEQLLPHPPASELGILTAANPASRSDSHSRVSRTGRLLDQQQAQQVDEHAILIDARQHVQALMGAGSLGLAGIGSNSWVVDGTKSTTGKPILANDPHLGARLPSTWYLAHLSAADLEVIGATIPGLPGVVIGRNRFISWGITNMFPDVQDLYRERLDLSGRFAEYQSRQEPVQIVTETIKVKHQPDVQQIVRITRHGPLFSDFSNTARSALPPEERPPEREPLALRWTALNPGDGTVSALLGLNTARNWIEFTQALHSLVAPALNFVYADVQGNIGYYGAGLVPVRAEGDGLLPVEGWSGRYEWTGWIPFEELPHRYNPPEHMIVTANNLPASQAGSYPLGRDWEKPYRAQRITELLQAKDRLSPADFESMQGDTISLQARELLPLLLGSVDTHTEQERRAKELLLAWDGNTAAESAAAAIFEAWLRRLPRAIAEDELGPRLTNRYEAYLELYGSRFLAATLAERDNPWCDNTTTVEHENCQTVIEQTLRLALNDLQQQLGPTMEAWRWDSLHTIVFRHAPLSEVPIIQRLVSRSAAFGGDYSTINIGAFTFDDTFEQYGIAGYRQVVDLSRQDGSYFIQAIGQSGHFLSPHYDDYLNRWLAIRYLPMRFERARVDQDMRALLRLTP
jgi:penicillin G amidase